MPRRSTSSLILCLIAAGACDQSFEPIGESERYFSFFGVLEVTADTQWIRVMPVRKSVFTEPEPVDAVVTLTHAGTGEQITLRDSLMVFESADPDVIAKHYAHNFWTTEPLVSGATYTLAATRSDGAYSAATVKLPDDLERISVDIWLWGPAQGDRLLVEGGDNIALVHVLHLGHLRAFQSLSRIQSPAPGSYAVPISRLLPPIDFEPSRPCARGRLCTIEVITSGTPWPFDSDYTLDAILQSEFANNIENGAGFVAGIARKTIPYEGCERPGFTGRDDYCRLVYDSHSASLKGKVLDAGCGNTPVFPAKVELEQLGGDKVRFTETDAAGEFRIGGLAAESSYLLVVESPTYAATERVLAFSAGDTLEVDVSVQRDPVGCP